MQATIEQANDQAEGGVETPSVTFLNMSGDVTITWSAENRERILELVREKMKQGYHFFILKPRPLASVFGNSKERLTQASQLKGAVGIVVPDSQVAAIIQQMGDKDVANVVQQGHAAIAQAPRTQTHDTTRRAATAEEVVKHQSVAVKAIVGG
jgi:ribosomal protein L12E/L44/L45/RPP1/RPP2